jgi:hypothetical protein
MSAAAPLAGPRADGLWERVEIHPRLVEESVWTALRARPERAAFHRMRAPLYAVEPPEVRDAAFERAHLDWFRRLGLVEPVSRAVGEQSDALRSVGRFLMLPARRTRDQAAELFVAADGGRTIVVAIRPEVLADARATLALLRRELLHVADMLDPEFRYEPRLPEQPAGPVHDRILQDRYRVLWSCSVEGRLAALGRIDFGAREGRLAEFRGAFPALGDSAEACFERIFSGPRPDHPGLVALAADPARAAGGPEPARRAPGPCSLCGFPTHEFEPDPAALPREALEAIQSDHTGWDPGRPVCRQCADLYRARRMSEEAERLLPGIQRLRPEIP